jgi:bifunctional DNase/RNase
LFVGVGNAPCFRPARQAREPEPDFVQVEVATVGVGLESGAPVVLLQVPGSDRTMPIWVGLAEAQAIARSLQGIEEPRPMTHDLLVEMTKVMGGVIEEVRVIDSRGGVYYGEVRLRMPGERQTKNVDSRPSDALALALRTGAPIRVRRDLIDTAPKITFLPPEVNDQVVHSLGLTLVAPTRDLRRIFGLPERDGVVVLRANPTAESAGLKRGDLITKVNGTVPTRPIDFLEAVRAAPAGEAIGIRYWREGSEREIRMPRPAPEHAPSRRPEIRT